MLSLKGEYDCKVDAKGRFMFPVSLKNQLGDVFDKGFIINRNLHEKCLVLYPVEEWNKLSKKLASLNRLIQKNDLFVRKVNGGATPVDADSAGRVLLPKSLSDYAEIDTDIRVLGSTNVIEIWSKVNHDEFINRPIDMKELAEDVMGGMNFNDDIQ